MPNFSDFQQNSKFEQNFQRKFCQIIDFVQKSWNLAYRYNFWRWIWISYWKNRATNITWVMDNFLHFNPYGLFCWISYRTYEHLSTFLNRPSYEEKGVDYPYISQMAVGREVKGHIVDFLKIFINFFDIFLTKERGKKLSRDFFGFFLVSTCSPGYDAS